jgi:hypothetical protein
VSAEATDTAPHFPARCLRLNPRLRAENPQPHALNGYAGAIIIRVSGVRVRPPAWLSSGTLQERPLPHRLDRLGRGFIAATVAVVVICAAVLGSVGAIARGLAPPPCGPAKGQTLLEGRRARIYLLPRSKSPYPDRIFACLAGSGRVWRLNRSPKDAPFCCGRWAGVGIEHLAIHAPWVAYQENFSGVDT